MSCKPDPEDLILLGVVIGVRGLEGDIRIKSFTAVKEDLAAYGPLWDKFGCESYRVRITGEAQGHLVARIEGVSDRKGAEALKGLELFIPRGSLPKLGNNEFYYSDLIGLDAVSTEGEPLGRVSAVDNYGAGDVLEITGGSYTDFMVPFELEVVPKIDFDLGILTINLPEGLLKPSDDELEIAE